ncbi:MAG: replicative DNA helicase [Prolixibacteraceae bacterium]
MNDNRNKKNWYKDQQQNTIDQINAQYGKLPPQAIEVEEAVLGAVMLERDAIYKVMPIINHETFYKDEHQKIFELIERMAAEGKQIDLLQVTQRLKDEGLLEEIGGPGEITILTRRVASAAHIEYHAFTIRSKYIQREIIRSSARLQEAAYDPDPEIAKTVYAEETQRIDNLMAGSSGMVHIRDILVKTTEDLEARQVKIKEGKAPGVYTGLADLDRWTTGWQPTDLIIIAARPSMGKTAIALHFAKSAAIRGDEVCIFSLEMENIRLSKRLILSNGGVDRSIFENRLMTDGDWDAYNRSRNELQRLPIYIDDTARTTARYIDSVVRNKVRQGKCKLVVIDYLQLVESVQTYGQKNREREVAEISRSLKQTAKDNHVPIILLGQLNRGVENREDKTPRLADLRESGAIEQDADVVIFPWRPCYYDKDAVTEDGTSLKNVMFLEIAKNREGNTGTIWCKHNEDLTQFFDYEFREYQIPEGTTNDVPY